MKKIDAQKYINEILAFASGKIIEHKSVGSGVWYEDENPSFACNLEYRIKPELKLVPFTFEDNKLLQGKYICRNGFTAMYKIIGIDQNGVSLIHSGKFKDINYNDLFILYCFSDGSNCGKYINE